MSEDHGYHYVCYQWTNPPRTLPPAPRIARGTGSWVPSDEEAIRRRPGEHRCEAFYAFPLAVATDEEVKALEGKPQEDW